MTIIYGVVDRRPRLPDDNNYDERCTYMRMPAFYLPQ